jgi:hypothetical protein
MNQDFVTPELKPVLNGEQDYCPKNTHEIKPAVTV